MRRRNRYLLQVVFLGLTSHFLAQSGSAPPAQPPPATSASPAPTQTSPAPAPAPAPAPESSPAPGGQAAPQGTEQTASQGAGQAPDTGDSGAFVFRKQVEEVVLHATVFDDKQRFVTNLEKNAFTVYEDGHPQTITSFRHEDIPVSIGIVVDNSGSMREKRQKVNAAALNLVRASNPNDEVFVVNFNDEYYLDQDFTANINKLREALEKIETRGGTA